jgi:hypothetical protein
MNESSLEGTAGDETGINTTSGVGMFIQDGKQYDTLSGRYGMGSGGQSKQKSRNHPNMGNEKTDPLSNYRPAIGSLLSA